MQLKWLDDFITLIETESVTKTSERRHISQPALSRRIQAFESWLGVSLIDRQHKPLRLAPIASRNVAAFRNLAAHIYQFRAFMEQEALSNVADITIAAQHSLATSFMSTLLERMHDLDAQQSFQIRTANRIECVDMLIKNQAGILVIHETSVIPNGLPPHFVDSFEMGPDELILVGNAELAPKYLSSDSARPLQLLAYPSDSFFGRLLLVDAMPRLLHGRTASVKCMSEFSFSLRELALIGQGAAWLPRSMIARELEDGRLVHLERLARPVPLTIAVHFAKFGSAGVQRLADGFRAIP